MKASEPAVASLFHAGNTCPHCQETIVAGQLIVSCTNCGSTHHESCWLRKPGCASYHCDVTVRSNTMNMQPDIVINTAELANVRPPPPPIRRKGEDISAPFLPKKPERVSKLALGSVILAGLSLVGIGGAIAGSPPVVVLAIAGAIAAMTLGVIALVVINNTENRVSGFKLAGAGVLLPAILIVVLFINLSRQYERTSSQQAVDFKLAQNLPTEDQLSRAKPATANAMRANVVIRSSASMLGETRYGSGIIVRLKDHRAYILTNKHVIGDKKTSGINIIFYNGEQSSATVEWEAPKGMDIAVLACQVLSLDKYKPISVAPNMMGPGEKVFAIGNPMELSWSYTEGTISSVRTNSSEGQDVDLYQTQTPINSGNSGGGLYTADGELIGVNTMTEDKAKTEGLNFAIALPGILKQMDAATRERLFGPSTVLPEIKPKAEDDQKF